MFGVTTAAVQGIVRHLEPDFDCLVFHATGTGGRSMESLADFGMLAGFVDLTTTEVADMLVGGVFPADGDRFGAAIRTRLPWIGSVGAMDMVNFGPRDTVPDKFAARRFVIHNPNVTLMRTTPQENRAIGEWMGARINQMEGPVRLLLARGGRLGPRLLRASRSTIRRPTQPCSRRWSRLSARRRSDASSESRRTSTTTPSSRRRQRLSCPPARVARGEPDAET